MKRVYIINTIYRFLSIAQRRFVSEVLILLQYEKVESAF
jgi:hypothetical protein